VGVCDRPVTCRGWCKKHYSRWRKTGTIDDPPPRKIIDPNSLRLCPKCGEYSPASEWYQRSATCRACSLAQRREHYAANRERIKTIMREKYATDPERFRRVKRESTARTREAVNARQRAWWAARGAQLAAEQHQADPRKRKNFHLKRRYGITIEQYDQMCERQGGACAICHESPKILYVDHCHVTGQVRGLLCNTCNTAMGSLRDEPLLAYRAALYLTGLVDTDGLVWEGAVTDACTLPATACNL
jgi:hypothetical protein